VKRRGVLNGGREKFLYESESVFLLSVRNSNTLLKGIEIKNVRQERGSL
jgi:hypothetical protein